MWEKVLDAWEYDRPKFWKGLSIIGAVWFCIVIAVCQLLFGNKKEVEVIEETEETEVVTVIHVEKEYTEKEIISNLSSLSVDMENMATDMTTTFPMPEDQPWLYVTTDDIKTEEQMGFVTSLQEYLYSYLGTTRSGDMMVAKIAYDRYNPSDDLLYTASNRYGGIYHILDTLHQKEYYSFGDGSTWYVEDAEKTAFINRFFLDFVETIYEQYQDFVTFVQKTESQDAYLEFPITYKLANGLWNNDEPMYDYAIETSAFDNVMGTCKVYYETEAEEGFAVKKVEVDFQAEDGNYLTGTFTCHTKEEIEAFAGKAEELTGNAKPVPDGMWSDYMIRGNTIFQIFSTLDLKNTTLTQEEILSDLQHALSEIKHPNDGFKEFLGEYYAENATLTEETADDIFGGMFNDQ